MFVCSQGRTVDFKNTIVVMTSNLGSADILDTLTAFDPDLLRERVMQQVRRCVGLTKLNIARSKLDTTLPSAFLHREGYYCIRYCNPCHFA